MDKVIIEVEVDAKGEAQAREQIAKMEFNVLQTESEEQEQGEHGYQADGKEVKRQFQALKGIDSDDAGEKE